MPPEHWHHEEGHDGPPPTYTPWLLIRYAALDMGSRPLPPGTVFWASEDILPQPVDQFGRVQAGDNVFLTAVVQNLGYGPAYNVTVDFFWADPSAGIILPSGPPIGSKTVNIPAGQVAMVVCPQPWIPQFVNGGHECLVVQCSCPADPLITPFRPDLDRHVAQRNMTVLPQQAVQGGKLLRVKVINPTNDLLQTGLYLTSRRMFGGEEATQVFLANEFTTMLALAGTRDGRYYLEQFPLDQEFVHGEEFGIHLIDISYENWPGSGLEKDLFHDQIAKRADLEPEFDPTIHGTLISELELEPDQAAWITMEISDSAVQDGAIIIHQFSHVLERVELGGYTMALTTVD